MMVLMVLLRSRCRSYILKKFALRRLLCWVRMLMAPIVKMLVVRVRGVTRRCFVCLVVVRSRLKMFVAIRVANMLRLLVV